MVDICRLISTSGSLVLVCGRCCCALRRASNLYQARGRPHRRRLGRIRCRSDGRIVDLSLPRVSLAGEPLDSAIQCARNFLFRSHRRLRWRRHNCLFSSLSKRWATFCRSCNSGLWCGPHGDRWHFIFPRTSILAACPGDHAGDYWITFAAALRLWKQCLHLRLRHTVCRYSGCMSLVFKPSIKNRQHDQGEKC